MEDAVAAVRRFNRFYTRFVGALDADFLGTGMSLAEARLLFEIATRDVPPLATDLEQALGMDRGFLSRVVARFETNGWVARARDRTDGRRRPIGLTPEGRKVFGELDERQRTAVKDVVGRLDDPSRERLSAVLTAAETLLRGERLPAFALRTFKPGDMGLLVSRQTVLYHDLYGWNSNIEINECEVVSGFLRNFKPGRDQCWIAEVDGEMAGSVIVTDEGDGLARLRLLYVEPRAQGLGIGSALVDECLGFARDAGYSRVTLWTHSILEAARRIYARAGFGIVSTEEHDTFGPTLLGETWEVPLETR